MPKNTRATPAATPSQAEIRDFLETQAAKYLAMPNVTGVGVAAKHVGGQGTADLAVVFDVAVKLASSAELAAAGTPRLPSSVMVGTSELPTDVVERWYVLEGNAVQPGVSSSNADGQTGTLGPLVRRRDASGLYVLSNLHVLGLPATQSRVLQPGRIHGGMPGQDDLGIWAGPGSRLLDAIVATIDNRQASRQIAGLGVAVDAFRAPRKGMRVMKSGMATGVTCGIIDEEFRPMTRRLPDEALRSSVRSLVIKIDRSWPDSQRPLSDLLDSGSAWMLVEDGKPTGTMVALHWGGDGLGTEAYACSITEIADALGIEPATQADLAVHNARIVDAIARPSTGRPSTVRSLGQMQVNVRNERARVRPNPNTNDAPVTRLDPGTRVFVLDRKAMPDGFTWMQVDLEGDGRVDGWVRGDLLGPVNAVQPARVPRATIDGRAIAAEHGVEVKSDAVMISELDAVMAPVIPAVADAARALGLPKPVITSGNDSRHSKGSLHFVGRALDFRGRNISDGQGHALARAVSERLGPNFDVIFEIDGRNPANNHLHVEFDPD